MLLQAREVCGRIGIAGRIPPEIEARLHVPHRAAVERDHVTGNLPRAQLFGNCHRFVRRAIVRTRDPQSQAPQRDIRRAPGQQRVALQHLRRIAAGDQEEIERLVVDDRDVRTMGPFRMADPVGDAAGGVDENSPGTGLRRAAAGAPAEGRAFVRAVRVDAERIFDLRGHELAALVERAKLFAQAVHRLAGDERERGEPLRSIARAADDGQAREAPEMLVGH